MSGNPFQKAVVEINCAVNGYVDMGEDGPTAEEQLKALGGSRLVSFKKGWSPKLKGSTGAPSKDCQEGDEDSKLQLAVSGFGHVEGVNLEDAKAQMIARIKGEPAPASKTPASKTPASKK